MINNAEFENLNNDQTVLISDLMYLKCSYQYIFIIRIFIIGHKTLALESWNFLYFKQSAEVKILPKFSF